MKRKRTLPSGMAHEQDCLGYFIALAYHKFPERMPAHLKPPYDKTKFAFTRDRIPETTLQPRNPIAFPADAERAAVDYIKAGSAPAFANHFQPTKTCSP